MKMNSSQKLQHLHKELGISLGSLVSVGFEDNGPLYRISCIHAHAEDDTYSIFGGDELKPLFVSAPLETIKTYLKVHG